VASANPFNDPPTQKPPRLGKRKRGIGKRGERRSKSEIHVRSHLAALMAMLPSVATCGREWDKAKKFSWKVTRDKTSSIVEKLMAHRTLVNMLMHEHKIRQYVDEQQQTAGIPIAAEYGDGEQGVTLNGVRVMVNRITIVRDQLPAPQIVSTQAAQEAVTNAEDGDGD
jgi:hypothetical protein